MLHAVSGCRPTEAKEKNSAGIVWSARTFGGPGAPPASGAYRTLGRAGAPPLFLPPLRLLQPAAQQPSDFGHHPADMGIRSGFQPAPPLRQPQVQAQLVEVSVGVAHAPQHASGMRGLYAAADDDR